MAKKGKLVTFVKSEMVDGHMEYTMTIADQEGGELVQLKDRYSSMRSYWERLTGDFERAAPRDFPPKKCCGNTDAQFVSQRMSDLERFFNQVFDNPRLAKAPCTKAYIESKKVQRKGRHEEKKAAVPAQVQARNQPRPGLPEEIKDPRANQPSAKAAAYEPPVMSLDKVFRKTADNTTSKYIDISFTEEPPQIEEIKDKTRKYAQKIERDIDTIPYMSKLLGLPRGGDQPLTLDGVENERAMAEWLTSKMETLASIVANKLENTYVRETIQFEFNLT
jgi:hypothetical protein